MNSASCIEKTVGLWSTKVHNTCGGTYWFEPHLDFGHYVEIIIAPLGGAIVAGLVAFALLKLMGCRGMTTYNANTPTVYPKAGKRYVRRDGEVTGIVEDVRDGSLYPFEDKNEGECWTEKGEYYSRNVPHDKDLVAEHPAEEVGGTMEAKVGRKQTVTAEEQDGACTVLKSKYHRRIRSELIDVYDVLVAFEVADPAVAHAVKKLLVPGGRGHKDKITDLREAAQAIARAIEIEEEKQ